MLFEAPGDVLRPNNPAESTVDEDCEVGIVLLLASLSVTLSEDLSVANVALERLLRSFRNEGAILNDEAL